MDIFNVPLYQHFKLNYLLINTIWNILDCQELVSKMLLDVEIIWKTHQSIWDKTTASKAKMSSCISSLKAASVFYVILKLFNHFLFQHLLYNELGKIQQTVNPELFWMSECDMLRCFFKEIMSQQDLLKKHEHWGKDTVSCVRLLAIIVLYILENLPVNAAFFTAWLYGYIMETF